MKTKHQRVSLSVFRGASKGGQDQRDGQTDRQTRWQDEEYRKEKRGEQEEQEVISVFVSLSSKAPNPPLSICFSVWVFMCVDFVQSCNVYELLIFPLV